HQETERHDDAKTTPTLRAESLFSAKKHRLADGYGTPSDITDGVCLTFPTSVTFEKRRDGVYCHFSRIYQPRAWATIEQLREAMVQEPLGDIAGEPSEWTPAQRIAITQALARFEIEKNITFVRAAWVEALANQPHDGYLAMRDDLHAFITTLDYEALANLLVPPQNNDEEKALQQAIQLQS